MKQSAMGKANPIETEYTTAERQELIIAVKYPNHVAVSGFEALGIGERFNLFFKEVSTTIDKRMAVLAKSIHTVDYPPVQKHLEKNEILYVKNTHVQMLTPVNYHPGLGNMMAHTRAVIDGVYIIGSLKTEASRLYDWLKQVLTKGRMDTDFKWTIGEFGMAISRSEEFIKNLPDTGRNLNYNLGQIYVSYDEIWDCMNVYNQTVRTMGARDAEITVKVLGDVYDLGRLLVQKIQANDIMLDQKAVDDIESVVNKFAELTNVAGVMMVLLNELTAVFNSQLKTLKELKY